MSNADRAGAYGMPGVRVERNDALEVFEAAGEDHQDVAPAVARAPHADPTRIDHYVDYPSATLEDYQQKDGSVTVPEALRPYTHRMEMMEPGR